jgi:hypothetical protein
MSLDAYLVMDKNSEKIPLLALHEVHARGEPLITAFVRFVHVLDPRFIDELIHQLPAGDLHCCFASAMFVDHVPRGRQDQSRVYSSQPSCPRPSCRSSVRSTCYGFIVYADEKRILEYRCDNLVVLAVNETLPKIGLLGRSAMNNWCHDVL